MNKRVLTILEVSQKQAYIFSSNKLQDNIINSAVIAWIMSPEYFEKSIGNRIIFSKEHNLVYSGGGHTVLEFNSKETAAYFTKKITKLIHNTYEGIEVFAKTMEYKEEKNPEENLKILVEKLERKKSKRISAFHQGSFGVEKESEIISKPTKMPEQENKIDKELCPTGFHRVWQFEKLGGTRNDTNFIAVIHIDGNAMGKRVENFQKTHKHMHWNEYKESMKNFSESIDRDFKDAYKEMAELVAQNIKDGKLKDLSLEDSNFPIRRIITAGDDICFVAEGRIGIECAAAFIKALSKKTNAEDKEGYSACAGVALVHQKYPFYKAYELAEMLCSNAKKFGASLSMDGSGKDVSVIDWHIEFGEMKDSLEEIRKDYNTLDNSQNRLELRPYIVSATEEIKEKEPIRQYKNFKKLVTKILTQDIAYSKGKMKELRSVLKQGEISTKYFLKFNKIEDIILESYYDVFKEIDYNHILSGKEFERPVFVSTEQDKNIKRSVLFDAIEILDTYITLDY